MKRVHRRRGVRPRGAAGMRVLGIQPRHARPGTVVTILGKNFRRGIYLRYGRVRINLRSVQRNRITFVVPRLPAGMRAMVVVWGRHIVPAGPFKVLPMVVAPRAAHRIVVRTVAPRQAVPGAIITVYGTGFRPGVHVRYGPMRINPRTVIATAITFVVPRLAASVKPLVVGFGRQVIPAGNFRIMPVRGVAGHRPPPVPAARPGHPAPPPRGGYPAGRPIPGRHAATPPPHVGRPAGRPLPSGHAGAPPPHGRPGGETIEARRRRLHLRRLRRMRRWRKSHPVVTRVDHPAPARYVVHGKNFRAHTQVLFNHRPIPRASITAVSISFVVPTPTVRGVITLHQRGLRRPVFVAVHKAAPLKINKVLIAQQRAAELARQAAMRKAARQRWLARQRVLARLRSRAARLAAYNARWLQLVAQREARRRARLAALRARWKAQFLANEQVRAELALHAERVARLHQMQRLAELDNNSRLAMRILLVISRENLRHTRRLAELKIGIAATATAGGAPQ